MEGTEHQTAAVTLAEAERDFPRVARLAARQGRVTVTEDGRPRYLVIDLEREPQLEMTEEEKLDFVAGRILREHRAAFEELAK